MTADVRLYVALGALVLLVVAGLVALSLVVRHVGRIEVTLRKLHVQQSNIIAMLLRAGFRPARTLNWLEDGDETRVAGETAYTQFDWRNPSDGDVSG